MNANLFRFFRGLSVTLVMASGAIGQESPGVKPERPASDQSAVAKGITWLKAQHQDAIQYDQALSLLLADKLVSSGDLGIDLAEIQPALRAQLNLAEGTGLVVTTVPEDSPGAKAGLRPHDVLVSIGATLVGNLEQVAQALQDAKEKSADKTASLGVVRQGKKLTLKVTPKSPQIAEVILSDSPVTLWSKVDINIEPRYRIGVVLSEADDTLRAQVGLAAGEGLIVTEVFPDTPAAQAGIQPHDVLVILDGKRLSTVDAVNVQIQEIKGREIELTLLRKGKEVAIKIAPQKEAGQQRTVDEYIRALTFWNPAQCSGQLRTESCTNCHRGPFPEGWMRAADYHRLSYWIEKGRTAEAGTPQEQVNQLKVQLAKMQETLSTLEASLVSSAATEKNQPKSGENK